MTKEEIIAYVASLDEKDIRFLKDGSIIVPDPSGEGTMMIRLLEVKESYGPPSDQVQWDAAHRAMTGMDDV
jgi:hypothetical protein